MLEGYVYGNYFSSMLVKYITAMLNHQALREGICVKGAERFALARASFYYFFLICCIFCSLKEQVLCGVSAAHFEIQDTFPIMGLSL